MIMLTIHEAARRSFEQRFWEKVDRSRGECWLWTGSTNKHGYGQIQRGPDGPADTGKRLIMAHRAAWLMLRGPIPEGMFLCHTCDTPACVNPMHLFVGTQRDNMRDAAIKGRIKMCPPRHGTDNHNAKLNTDVVQHIRREYGLGATISAIARAVGVARTTVREVVTGRCWKTGDVETQPRKAPTQRIDASEHMRILARRLMGESLDSIAKDYGVSRRQIGRIETRTRTELGR